MPDPSAAALPTGTVTFLFTDIQGSTKRWEAMLWHRCRGPAAITPDKPAARIGDLVNAAFPYSCFMDAPA